MKIAGVRTEKIYRWVSQTSDSGFNIPDLQSGLNLDEYKNAEIIFGYLKQNNKIKHAGGNSPLYIKTSEIEKPWYVRPLGLTILSVLGAVIAFIIGLIILALLY